MNDLDVSALLMNLSDDYSNNRISFIEYRSQRRIILRQLDEEYNQMYLENESNEQAEIENKDENIIIQEAEQ